MSINIGDTWKAVTNGSINIGDVWKAWTIGTTSSSSSSVSYPRIAFFDNFSARDFVTLTTHSNATWSFQAVAIPGSLSFNYPIIFLSHSSTSKTATSFNWSISMGLYSFDGTSLQLVNSASANYTNDASKTAISWISLATSATSDITPGQWYFGLAFRSGGNASVSFGINSSINPGNASPVFVKGRMTASSSAPPTAIATSDLDITGSDAVRQPHFIITA